jgi:hypothetical protein
MANDNHVETCQDNRIWDRDLYLGPSEQKTEALPTRPLRSSVIVINYPAIYGVIKNEQILQNHRN